MKILSLRYLLIAFLSNHLLGFAITQPSYERYPSPDSMAFSMASYGSQMIQRQLTPYERTSSLGTIFSTMTARMMIANKQTHRYAQEVHKAVHLATSSIRKQLYPTIKGMPVDRRLELIRNYNYQFLQLLYAHMQDHPIAKVYNIHITEPITMIHHYKNQSIPRVLEFLLVVGSIAHNMHIRTLAQLDPEAVSLWQQQLHHALYPPVVVYSATQP